MDCFACILLHTLLGMSRKYVITTTSISRWRIVCVETMIACCCGCWPQYQLVMSLMEKIYYDLTTNSPAVIFSLSIVELFCSVYPYDMNLITQYTFVDVSAVLMEPYLKDWNNESILSLIPSITNQCISSNAPKGVYFGDKWTIFQLLNKPRTVY